MRHVAAVGQGHRTVIRHGPITGRSGGIPNIGAARRVVIGQDVPAKIADDGVEQIELGRIRVIAAHAIQTAVPPVQVGSIKLPRRFDAIGNAELQEFDLRVVIGIDGGGERAEGDAVGDHDARGGEAAAQAVIHRRPVVAGIIGVPFGHGMKPSARVPREGLGAVGGAVGVQPDPLRKVARVVEGVPGGLPGDAVGEGVGCKSGEQAVRMQGGGSQLVDAGRQFHLRVPQHGVGADGGDGQGFRIQREAEGGLPVNVAVSRVQNGVVGFGADPRKSVGDAAPLAGGPARRSHGREHPRPGGNATVVSEAVRPQVGGIQVKLLLSQPAAQVRVGVGACVGEIRAGQRVGGEQAIAQPGQRFGQLGRAVEGGGDGQRTALPIAGGDAGGDPMLTSRLVNKPDVS